MKAPNAKGPATQAAAKEKGTKKEKAKAAQLQQQQQQQQQQQRVAATAAAREVTKPAPTSSDTRNGWLNLKLECEAPPGSSSFFTDEKIRNQLESLNAFFSSAYPPEAKPKAEESVIVKCEFKGAVPHDAISQADLNTIRRLSEASIFRT